MTPEELASTMEGHAASCDRQAAYQRNRERATGFDHVARTQHRDLAVANEAKAECLRQWATRVREEFANITTLMAQTQHYVSVGEDGWVIEHSIGCRLAGIMGSCEFTEWAKDHLDGSRRYPLGRFLMNVDDPMYMALEPA